MSWVVMKVERVVKYLNNIFKALVMLVKMVGNTNRVMLNLCQAGRARPLRRSC